MTLDTSITKTPPSFLSIFLPFPSTCTPNVSKSADAATATANTLIRDILSLYKQLSSFSSLEPREEVNAVFGNLVELCITTLSDDAIENKILKDARISAITPHLRTLCSAGECALESHWANVILRSPTSATTINLLLLFPYYKNYLDLSRLELNAVLSITPTAPSAIAFIGSSPLPLTSICTPPRRGCESSTSTTTPPPSPCPRACARHSPVPKAHPRSSCARLRRTRPWT